MADGGLGFGISGGGVPLLNALDGFAKRAIHWVPWWVREVGLHGGHAGRGCQGVGHADGV